MTPHSTNTITISRHARAWSYKNSRTELPAGPRPRPGSLSTPRCPLLSAHFPPPLISNTTSTGRRLSSIDLDLKSARRITRTRAYWPCLLHHQCRISISAPSTKCPYRDQVLPHRLQLLGVGSATTSRCVCVCVCVCVYVVSVVLLLY